MNSNKIRAGILAAVVFASGTFGLAGCASDTSANSGSSTGSTSSEGSSVQSSESDVTTDLEAARQAVVDGLEAKPGSTQIMLAADVKQPTEKYGMLVMPFVKSDAAKRVTGTVNIDGTAYVIEAESAETGQTWQIDQDGNITEVK
ncbi:hypothetical protein [Microbacterium telephonicum]|uniref:Lipoprotein n=1 Tax=Microbacterium telephonicum TaxID=1714841 RepID=A0A498BWU9_9MICO|nr:hypothetical protein [Microbacterium telephonicum]RLK48124.1 hypothetical protein C7474_2727 [Microbacterium telephonicum]